jgi:hypothetical protein
MPLHLPQRRDYRRIGTATGAGNGGTSSRKKEGWYRLIRNINNARATTISIVFEIIGEVTTTEHHRTPRGIAPGLLWITTRWDEIYRIFAADQHYFHCTPG